MEPMSSDCPLDSRRMEMLRALLPYIPITMQKFLNIYIGFEELMKAIRIIQNGAFTCPAQSSDKVEKPEDLVKLLRSFCTPKENEMIDTVLNMSQMMSMYDSYKDMFDMFGGAGKPDISGMFKGDGKPDISGMFKGDGKPDISGMFKGDGKPDISDMFKGAGNPKDTSASSANPLAMLNQIKQFQNTQEIDDLFQNFVNE